MTDPDPALWTLDAVAAYLSVSRQTLYRWRVVGAGPPAIRIGGQLRFKQSDVLQWVETQRDR